MRLTQIVFLFFLMIVILLITGGCSGQSSERIPCSIPAIEKLTYILGGEEHVLLDNQTDISIDVAKFIVYFDQPMSKQGYSLCGNTDWITQYTYSTNQTFEIIPNLDKGTEYYFFFNCPSSSKGFENRCGDKLPQYEHTFYTEGYSEPICETPIVSGINYEWEEEMIVLQDGMSIVPFGMIPITIQFDQEMNTEGMSICGDASWITNANYEDGKTFLLQTVLEPGKEYTIVLNCPSSSRGFRNICNKPLDFFTLTFTTKTE